MTTKVKMVVTHPKGFRMTVNGVHKLFAKGEGVEVSPHVAKRFPDRLKDPKVLAAEAAAAKAAVEAATGSVDDDNGKPETQKPGGGDPKPQGGQGQSQGK